MDRSGVRSKTVANIKNPIPSNVPVVVVPIYFDCYSHVRITVDWAETCGGFTNVSEDCVKLKHVFL